MEDLSTNLVIKAPHIDVEVNNLSPAELPRAYVRNMLIHCIRQIPATSLHEFFLDRLTRHPSDAPALVSNEGTSQLSAPGTRVCTYGELIDAIYRCAKGFALLGLGAPSREADSSGTAVAIALPNCIEYPVAFVGALCAGCTVTTINPAYTSKEIAYQLKNSSAELVVTCASFYSVIKAATDQPVIVIPDQAAMPANASTWSTLLDNDGKHTLCQSHPEALCVLPYSSGTTGLPKGVMLSHRNMVISNTALPCCLYMVMSTTFFPR